MLEIRKLLQRSAPDLQRTIERTHSLRVSHPRIEVAMSLYSQEDLDSIDASTDCLQAPSELNFHFDDIVINSTAYRRALAVRRSSPVVQPDDSGSLASVPDDVQSSQRMLGETCGQALHDGNEDNSSFLTAREDDASQVLVEAGNGWSRGRIDGVEGWLPGDFCERKTPTSGQGHEDVTGHSNLASVRVGESLSEAEKTAAETLAERVQRIVEKHYEESAAVNASMALVLEKHRLIYAEYVARQSELDR